MKLSKNQSGFSVVEVLLVLILLVIVLFAGYSIYHARKHTDKDAGKTTQTSVPQKLHTAQQALVFVQSTYDMYSHAEVDSQGDPAGDAALAAIKTRLAPAFYKEIKTAYAHPQPGQYDRIDCAQNTSVKPIGKLYSSDATTATIAVTDTGYEGINPFYVTVDLQNLLISNVTCQ